MAERQLYLIRHARADERGPEYPDDSQRPLVRKGFEQAKALAKLFRDQGLRLDRLFSSPYTRAAQTAEPLKARLVKGHNVQYLDSLADDDYEALLLDIRERVDQHDLQIALVGHEPYLGELASYLLTGEPGGLELSFKKAAVMHLSGSLEAETMALQSLTPYNIYKARR